MVRGGETLQVAMTRKQGNKTQTEAGGTGVVGSGSGDSFLGLPGTLCLQKSAGQSNSDSSPSLQYSPTANHLSLLFSLKLKLLSLPSNINCVLWYGTFPK